MSDSPGITGLNSEFQKEETHLVDLRDEIETLTQHKNRLKEDVADLEQDEQFTKDRLTRDTEVKRAEIRKKKLLKDIRQLGKVFFGLKKGKAKIEGSMEDITVGRVRVLGALGAEIDVALKDEAERLVKKSKKLIQFDTFLVELATYYTQYSTIFEARALSSERREAKIDKKVSDYLEIGVQLDTQQKVVADLLNVAQSKEEAIDIKYQEAAKLTFFFKNEADKEKHRLEAWSKIVTLREDTVKKQVKFNKKTEEELTKYEGWLDDRGKTLRRTINKLGLEKML